MVDLLRIVVGIFTRERFRVASDFINFILLDFLQNFSSVQRMRKHASRICRTPSLFAHWRFKNGILTWHIHNIHEVAIISVVKLRAFVAHTM